MTHLKRQLSCDEIIGKTFKNIETEEFITILEADDSCSQFEHSNNLYIAFISKEDNFNYMSITKEKFMSTFISIR